MSQKKLPRIRRDAANSKSTPDGYAFVFSDNIEDWICNKPLINKIANDNRRNNGNSKHFTRPTNG